MTAAYQPVGLRDLVHICRGAASIVKDAHTMSTVSEDAMGIPCLVTSDDAVRFNAYGAMIRVVWRDRYDFESIDTDGPLCPWGDNGIVSYAVSRIVAPDDFLDWQSTPGRTGSDVAGVLNRAADLIGRALAIAALTEDGDGAIVRDLVDLIEGGINAA